YEDYIYKPHNLVLNPQSYFSWHQDDKRIVQFYMNDSYLYSVVGLSQSSFDDCILLKINTKSFDQRCSIGNQVSKCTSNGNVKFGSLTISESGAKILHVKSFTKGIISKQGTTAVATYIIEFNVLYLKNDDSNSSSWQQCGSITLSDVVFVYSNSYDNYNSYNPCKLGIEGNLLACLILGEPYIFDIHDCNSAHPISSFSISSIRLGYAINRFDFLKEDVFFYEIVENYDSQKVNIAKGLVFDIKQELQPTLISSHIIYPTLATAITPAESLILIDFWIIHSLGNQCGRY
ncbi:hypothetical protein MXB_2590, partial [Myxobolus squamalis]